MELCLNFNEDSGYYAQGPHLGAKFLHDLFVRSWDGKVKAIYYLRNVNKGETKAEEGCVSCAN